MRKTVNKTRIEGRIYDHDLELKVSGANSKNPGTEFITGNLNVATDDAGINVVPVHFTYVTATTSSGKSNSTFNTLKGIIDGSYKTVIKDGADNASLVSIDSAIGLNEFFSDRNGKEELVSAKRNEGGFVHIVNTINSNELTRNTFDCDIIINRVTHFEADEEKGTAERAIVKGMVFDFRGALLPVELVALDSNAIAYFESLEASDSSPVFTRVWGKQISQTIVKTYTVESAFGGPEVREVPSTRKEFVITGANPSTYEWDEEGSITAQELKNLLAERETYVATIKKRQDEYKASKQNSVPAVAPKATTPATQDFKF